MRPLPGMTVVGEYTDRFAADLATAALWDAGLESAVQCDPAHSIAPHLVTDRMFRVVVRDEVAEDARVILTDDREHDHEAEALDASYHRIPLAHRPAWFRAAAWTLFWSLPGAAALIVGGAALLLIRELFP